MAALDGRDITVHVNSPGGDVFEGLAIYHTLKSRKGKTCVQVDSLAASVASVIAMAGDEITIAPGGMMMIHDAWAICVGNEQDMNEMGSLLGKASAVLSGIYAAQGGGTPDHWRDLMRAETWYSASEAVEAGLVSSVLDYSTGEEEDPSEGDGSRNRFDLSMFNYAGRDNAPAPQTGVILDPAEFRNLLKEAFT